MLACPGLYCGRTITETVNDTSVYTDCGACPRGYRVNADFICQMCTKELSNYDWIYLGFMTIMPLAIHWFCIDLNAHQHQFSKGELILHFSALTEVVLSAILTILLTEPRWTFSIDACGVEKLSDWYTLFYNPSPRYESTLYCTQEAVYPIQTMVLVFYLLCTLFMVLLRPTLNTKFMPRRGKMAVYFALYILPVLSLLHVCFGGLIYFAFPYLSIIISVVSNAAHFSLKLDQTMKSLFRKSFTELRNVIIILGQWFLLAYGIISISIPHHIVLLALVPVPALFYILTAKYTCPENFN